MTDKEPTRVFHLDDLEKDYEGYAIPECPNCGKPIHWMLSSSGECHWCDARFEIEVQVTARVIDDGE